MARKGANGIGSPRYFYARALGLALAALLLAAFPAPAAQDPVATISVQTQPLGNEIPRDFLGLSMEVSTAGQALATPPPSLQMKNPAESGAEFVYSLGEPGAPNTAFFNFMRDLGPGVLRLGGNSQDNTCWDASAAPHPDWCHGTLSAGDLKLYAEAAKATGWKLILGLNLKEDSAVWARREVDEGIVKDIPRDEVLGLEIGNEPDLFSRDHSRPQGYTQAEDAHAFLSYVQALEHDPAAKSFAEVGPATCCSWRDPRDLATFIDDVGPSNLKLVTVHEYPTTTCGGRTVTVEQLLAPALMDKFNRAAQALVATAHERHVPIALAETNSASCGGMKDVSNSFAAALWGVDWMFSSFEDGFRYVNFHLSYRTGGSAYNPIETVGWQDAQHHWHYRNTAEPLYDAMYLFAHHAEGDHLLPASVNTQANIKAYAASACARCAVNVFVLNKDLKAAGEVHIHLPAKMGKASLLLVNAPKLDSTAADVRYGGGQFDERGHLPAPHTVAVRPDSHGDYDFTLPNASIALLTVEPAGK